MIGYVADLSWKSGARDWKVRSTKVDYGSECVNIIEFCFSFKIYTWDIWNNWESTYAVAV